MKNKRAGFLVSVMFVSMALFSGSAQALTVRNESANRIAAGVLLVQNERNQPVFLKIVDPRGTVEFKPEMKGKFIVSVANLDTKETTRLEGIQSNDSVKYDGKSLKK